MKIWRPSKEASVRKDDALALRDKLAAAARQAASKAGFDDLIEDGKLFHDEVGDVARWAIRLSPSQHWPHRPDAPCLRFEVWCFAGKPRPDEEVLLAVLLGADDAPDGLPAAVAPAFAELEQGGKYARRYKALEPLVRSFYPSALGVCRRAPLAWGKLEPAWMQLVTDVLKPLTTAVTAWDPDGTRRDASREAAAPDAMDALRRKFGG